MQDSSNVAEECVLDHVQRLLLGGWLNVAPEQFGRVHK